MIIENGVLVIVFVSDIVNGTFEFPAGVTSIGRQAFEGMKDLKTIEIPDSVTSINCWAFLRCENLKKVTIPKSVEFVSGLAFEGCHSINEINGKECKLIEFCTSIVKEKKVVGDIVIWGVFDPHYINNPQDGLNYYAESGDSTGLGYSEEEAIAELKNEIQQKELRKTPFFMDSVITHDYYCAVSSCGCTCRLGDKKRIPKGFFNHGLTVRELLPFLEKYNVDGLHWFKIMLKDNEARKMEVIKNEH